MKITLNILFLFLLFQSSAQQLNVVNVISGGEDDIYTSKKFALNKDDHLYSIGQFAGSFDIEGVPLSTTYQRGIYLIKSTINNDLVWAKKIADNDYLTELKPNVAISTDTSGNIIAGIQFYEKLYFFGDSIVADSVSDYYGVLMLKMDTSANLIWNKRIYGSAIGDYGITINTNNDILLTGMAQDDVFISKFSENGDSLWTRTGGGPSYQDIGEIVLTDSLNDIYLAGRLWCTNSVDFDGEQPSFPPGAAPYGSFVAKYDINGSIQWLKCFYPSTVSNFCIVTSMKISDEGDLLVGGQFNSNYVKFPQTPIQIGPNNTDGRYTGFLISYNSTGNLVWYKKTHTPIYGDDGVRNIATAEPGFFYVSSVFDEQTVVNSDTINGGTFGNILLEKYQNDGTPVWYYIIGGTYQDRVYDLISSNDKIYIIGGTNNNPLAFNGVPYSIGYGANMFLAELVDQTADIIELKSTGKSLVQIVDIMGRETEDKPNTLLIYVYSDGTTEKVFRVE